MEDLTLEQWKERALIAEALLEERTQDCEGLRAELDSHKNSRASDAKFGGMLRDYQEQGLHGGFLSGNDMKRISDMERLRNEMLSKMAEQMGMAPKETPIIKGKFDIKTPEWDAMSESEKASAFEEARRAFLEKYEQPDKIDLEELRRFMDGVPDFLDEGRKIVYDFGDEPRKNPNGGPKKERKDHEPMKPGYFGSPPSGRAPYEVVSVVAEKNEPRNEVVFAVRLNKGAEVCTALRMEKIHHEVSKYGTRGAIEIVSADIIRGVAGYLKTNTYRLGRKDIITDAVKYLLEDKL